MLIFDSVKKEKVKLILKEKNKANIYVCGPTVYDDAHLGHARSSICFDLLIRTLLANKIQVNYAKNYTDIDDKIIAKSKQTGENIEKITNFYINSYENDMKALNVINPNHKPKATDYIKQMIELILALKPYIYELDDGIYLDTSFDKKYFCLSHKNIENSQSRLENGSKKKNPSDFVLWKFDENYYEAPFGKGRPGWHSECVAMIDSIFGDSLDIHCGGADLLFPHHENEACQCRLKTGKKLANYWLHNAFVTLNNEKMSKSLQNCFFVKDMLKNYSGEVLRFYLQSTHYRSNFNFNDEDLKTSKKRLDKFYRTKERLEINNTDDLKLDEILDFPSKFSFTNEYFKECQNALNDDLNISKALSIFEDFCVYVNKILDNGNFELSKQLKFNEIFNDFSKLLGICLQNPKEYFCCVDESLKAEIESLIARRNEAKIQKNYVLADNLRDELSALGVILKDSKNGTTWELK